MSVTSLTTQLGLRFASPVLPKITPQSLVASRKTDRILSHGLFNIHSNTPNEIGYQVLKNHKKIALCTHFDFFCRQGSRANISRRRFTLGVVSGVL